MSNEELRRTDELWDQMNKRRLESGNEKIDPPTENIGRRRIGNYYQVYAD